MGKWHNSFNFLSKLTIVKVFNSVKVLIGFYVSKLIGKAIQYGMPINISVEPTTSCNLRCPECPSGLRSFTRKTGMLEENTLVKIIDELSKTLISLTFYFQGEPYLNKNFLKYVNLVHKKGIYSTTSTNAHYLDEKTALETVQSGLDKIIISIDGTTQETYESYRIGGSLEKVIEGTKNLVAAKNKLKSKKPFIVFQFLVVKHNQHQIEEIKSIAKELKIDQLSFKTAQIYDYENGSDLMPTIDQYSRYQKDKNGKFSLKNKLLNECWKMWHSAVITWDGKVVPCCFDKDAHHSMGKIQDLDFKTIWQNESYQTFRNQLLKSRSEIDICTNCTEGTKIWA